MMACVPPPIDNGAMNSAALHPDARRRVAIAQRVADAHRALDGDGSLLALISGSTVDNLVDELSDVDMSVVFTVLPPEPALRQACRQIGSDWFWTAGDLAAGEGGVVAFHVDVIEVQIGYTTHAALAADLDDLLLRHNPDTPNHKLAEGLAKALPLAGAERLAALQSRLAEFPEGLRRSMVRHGLAAPMPWRAAKQLLRRDAALWCREIQVEACYRLLLVLAGLNACWFTRFQVKRMRRLADKLALAPPHLAERIEALLAAPPREAFEALHQLEGEVLDLVAQQMPEMHLEAVRQRRAAWTPA
jgi:hypothetical protein